MSFRRALVAGIAVVVTTAAATASAQTVTCGGTMPNAAGANFTATPIYITGSTALEPLLKSFGPKLASQAGNPYVLIYLKDGSCAGVGRANGDGTIPAGKTMIYIPPDFDPKAGKTYNCSIGATAQLGDLVLSDVDATLCPGVSAQPPNTKDFPGPVNDMVLVVPTTSTQKGISAEEAYLVFGEGAAGMVMPWIDPTKYFIRTSDSGTRAMITANIGTGTHAWQGMDGTANGGTAFGSGDVLKGVSGNAMTAAEPTIGILGEDFYDSSTNRNNAHALAFRAFKQHFAYWPDSTLNATDRRNVRDGRYPMWGYVHMLLSMSNGAPVSAAGKYFVDLIQGTLSPAPSFSVLDAIIGSHLTPTCAMNVTHTIEGGAQKPYTDAAPCGCYFDSKAIGATAKACTVCTAADGMTDSACGTGKCRHGFCEAN